MNGTLLMLCVHVVACPALCFKIVDSDIVMLLCIAALKKCVSKTWKQTIQRKNWHHTQYFVLGQSFYNAVTRTSVVTLLYVFQQLSPECCF